MNSPSGNLAVNTKVEPFPSSLVNLKVPDIISASSLETARPRPVPSVRFFCVDACENGLKMFDWNCLGIPIPVSETENSNSTESRSEESLTARTVMVPFSVNFTALETRLETSWLVPKSGAKVDTEICCGGTTFDEKVCRQLSALAYFSSICLTRAGSPFKEVGTSLAKNTTNSSPFLCALTAIISPASTKLEREFPSKSRTRRKIRETYPPHKLSGWIL